MANIPSKMRRTTVIVTAAVVAMFGCSKTSDAHTAAFYRRRACADWVALSDGVRNRTMTSGEIVHKLVKMADDTHSAALFDQSLSGWTDAVNRLRVDIVDNDTTTETADVDAVNQPCQT